MKETRRCACRGLITAEPGRPVEVMARVQAHQKEPVHREWQNLGGMYLPEHPEDFGHIPVMVLRRVS